MLIKATIMHIHNKNNVIDVVLVFLLLTLNIFHAFFSVSSVDFEQVNVSWESIDWLIMLKQSYF